MKKQSIFICSSVKSLPIAGALERKLKEDFETEVWRSDTFHVAEHHIESITEASEKFTFALLVLTPDVQCTDDNKISFLVKDNLIFEMGFFIAVFGRQRTLFVVQKADGFRLPSYVAGINYAQFELHSNPNMLDTCLHAPCAELKSSIIKRLKKMSEHDVLMDGFVRNLLSTFCQALSSPFTPEEAKLRAFIFKKDANKLTCVNLWSPYKSSEGVGINFEINSETEKQVAIVMAAQRKETVGVSVSVLPQNLDGVHGHIDRELCFILAAPILSPLGEVWGIVDIDASNDRGENILRRKTTRNTLFAFGEILYQIFSDKYGGF